MISNFWPAAPYWPLRPGSFIDYRAFLIEGYWHNSTFELDVNKREIDPNQGIFRRTVVALPQTQYPVVATVHSTPPLIPTVDMDWSQASPLYQTLWKPKEGKAFIGESGSNRSIGFPPDPILAVDPVPGERITVDVEGYEFGDGVASPAAFRAIYGTISNSDHWWQDRFPDTVRTGLIERPNDAESYTYNYLWARDIGPIDAWWGWKDKFNHVRGWEWQIVSYG